MNDTEKRPPKIIVGSRKLWEAMGKEIEMDEATLAALTAYDNYTRLPEDVMGYGPMRAALTAALPHLSRQNGELRRAYDEMSKRSDEKTVYIAECEDAMDRLRTEVEHQRKEAKYWYDRYAEFAGRSNH